MGAFEHMSELRPASTRRDFLRHAGAAAVSAPLGISIATPLAAAAPVSRSANETLGIGVIGVGGMGSGHMDALISLAKNGKENLRVVAVSDVCKPRLDGAQAKAQSAQGGEVHAYRDYTELLARKDIDAVWIASPEHWHAQMSIDAIKAGKDVYVEKPMTLDLPQALELWNFAKSSDRIVEVGTQYVMEPKYLRVRELVASGAIGKALSSVTGYCRNTPKGEWNYYGIDERVKPGEMLDWARWCGPLGEAPFDTKIFHRWRRYRKYSTGIVGDLLVHMMTPLVHALDMGWPTRVSGIGGHYVDKDMENHDQVNLSIQFEKEHTMVVWGATNNARTPAPMVRGNKAVIELSGNNVRVTPEQPYADEMDEKTEKLPGATHDDLRLDFLGCVRERREPKSPLELGVKIMVIVDLAARSMWEGRTFDFDPQTMKVAAR
jgi:predicted dehydrogenase